jgi:hypothetical protein
MVTLGLMRLHGTREVLKMSPSRPLGRAQKALEDCDNAGTVFSF